MTASGAPASAVGAVDAVPAVRVVDVHKTYPGTQALAGISLEVEPGEVRALVGENGCGKSSLIGVLGGKVQADPGGRVEIYGQPLAQGDPTASGRAGVAVIHQELLVVPMMSALDNVFLGDLRRRGPMVDRAGMRAEYAQLSRRLGIDIDPSALAGRLSVAQQTLLEIMRAVRRQARVLLLDEPTATLGVPEREGLYEIVDGLRADGIACVFISHDLDEVLALCDSMTVLRDGREIRTAAREHWDRASLVRAMLGHAPGATPAPAATRPGDAPRPAAATPRSPTSSQPVALTVRDVRSGARTEVAELTVRRGEVVGLAGLVGSGRSSLLRTLAGAHPHVSGHMEVGGVPVRWPRTVAEGLQRGIALLPEDRKHDGLVLDMSAYDNVTLSDLPGVARGGMLTRGRSRARAAELLDAVGFRGRLDEPVRNLSGGNQQKVLVAKWMHRKPDVLLIDEPTRGVDVGATEEIMRVIRGLAGAGHAVVWASSELEEVVEVSHRVLLISDGALVGQLEGAAMTTSKVLEGLFAATDPVVADARPAVEETA